MPKTTKNLREIIDFGRFLGAFLGQFRGILGSSWVFGAILKPSWGNFGHLEFILGSWGRVGAIFGLVGGILGPTWGILGSTWGILGHLGANPRALRADTAAVGTFTWQLV